MIEQVVIVIVVAFVLFVLYRFRDFIFSTVLGGLVALVVRPSRMEQVRNKAQHERRERIREDFRTLSDTLLEHSVRGGRGEPAYSIPQKLAIIRQMVGGWNLNVPNCLGRSIRSHCNSTKTSTSPPSRHVSSSCRSTARYAICWPSQTKARRSDRESACVGTPVGGIQCPTPYWAESSERYWQVPS